MSKHTPAKRDVVDVPADNPEGTMERFTTGLKRVLSADKKAVNQQHRKRLRKNGRRTSP